MQHITVKDILEATNGELLCGDEATELTDLCINSREIKEGDLFIPIVGARDNAHKYIEGALEIGAATLTQEHYAIKAPKPYIKVSDTQEALQDIGRYIRNRMEIPFVAVTGSVGKTTTREMIAAALATECKVFHTKGNMNSQIGVPLTLSELTKQDEIAVLELGMSEPGQITRLSEMVKPQYAVVTNIGVAHIESLQTQENIRKEKLCIIDGMNKDTGVLFLNGDDPLLAQVRNEQPVTTYTYGCSELCDYRAENIRFENGNSYFDCVHEEERITVVLNVLGIHNVYNALAALGIANECGIPMAKAATAFMQFEGLRQKLIHVENKYTILDDTYNASPDSMKACLNVLCNIETTGKRVAVLGDMFELGENALQYHYQVGVVLSELPVDELIIVGEMTKAIKQAVLDSGKDIPIYEFSDNEEVAIYLMATLVPEDIVMIKGSNGMQMDEIVRILMA